MVSILSLWLPILLSAIFVFIISFLLHAVMTYHHSDFKGLPDEEKVMADLKKYNIPPGEYVIPHETDQKKRESEEFRKKVTEGPVAFLTVLENKMPSMGPQLIQWFLYSIVINIFAAYVAGRALGSEAHYLAVFRFVGVSAFLGYALALWQDSIWFSRAWSTTLKNTFDGLIYALITAGTFGWLWG